MKKEIDLDALKKEITDELIRSYRSTPEYVNAMSDRIIAKITKPSKAELIKKAKLMVNSGNHYGSDLRLVAQGYLDLVAEGEKTAVQAAPAPPISLDSSWVGSQLGDHVDDPTGRIWMLARGAHPRLPIDLVLRAGRWLLVSEQHPSHYFAQIKYRHQLTEWQAILETSR